MASPTLIGDLSGITFDLQTAWSAVTNTAWSAATGAPSPSEIQAGADQVVAEMARAGASPEEQQAAANEYRQQIVQAGKAFDQNSPYSNPLQRLADGDPQPADASSWFLVAVVIAAAIWLLSEVL